MTHRDPGDEVSSRHQRRARTSTERVAYYCMNCPLTFPDAPSSNAHHDATGHHQHWKPEHAYKASPAAAKEDVMQQHESGHEDRLGFIREKLRELYTERKRRWLTNASAAKPIVTADDAAKILEAASNLGYTDDDAARPWFGAIFRGRGWRAVGWVPSLRAENKGRAIRSWRWEP